MIHAKREKRDKQCGGPKSVTGSSKPKGDVVQIQPRRAEGVAMCPQALSSRATTPDTISGETQSELAAGPFSPQAVGLLRARTGSGSAPSLLRGRGHRSALLSSVRLRCDEEEV